MTAFARHTDNNGAGPLVTDWTPADMDTYDQAVIEVYSNCQEVELFINGESQGRRPMPENARPALYNVNYNSGKLDVVGYNNGTEAARSASRTADEPNSIIIEKVGGEPGTGFDDVEILSIQLVDKDGNVCPNSDRRIELSATGAKLIAVDNADVLAHETSHKSATFNTYQGRMVAYIRRTSEGGKVTVTATDCSSAAALKGSNTF
jgi:beta-galactosidase